MVFPVIGFGGSVGGASVQFIPSEFNLYTDASAVAAELGFTPDAVFSQNTGPGATNIFAVSARDGSTTLSASIGGADVPYGPGMLLAVDYWNEAAREVVQLGAAPTEGRIVLNGSMQNTHVAGVPIVSCGRLARFIRAACGKVDQLCQASPMSRLQAGYEVRLGPIPTETPLAFGPFGTWKETVVGQITYDGALTFQTSAYHVVEMQSMAFTTRSGSEVQTIDLTADPSVLSIKQYDVRYEPTEGSPHQRLLLDGSNKNVKITVTYSAGYQRIPDEIYQAATLIATYDYRRAYTGLGDNWDEKAFQSQIADLLRGWRRV